MQLIKQDMEISILMESLNTDATELNLLRIATNPSETAETMHKVDMNLDIVEDYDSDFSYYYSGSSLIYLS